MSDNKPLSWAKGRAVLTEGSNTAKTETTKDTGSAAKGGTQDKK